VKIYKDYLLAPMFCETGTNRVRNTKGERGGGGGSKGWDEVWTRGGGHVHEVAREIFTFLFFVGRGIFKKLSKMKNVAAFLLLFSLFHSPHRVSCSLLACEEYALLYTAANVLINSLIFSKQHVCALVNS
jgi:hypothetical protein